MHGGFGVLHFKFLMRTITDKVDAIFSVADNYIRDSTQDPSIVSTQVISTRQATAEGD